MNDTQNAALTGVTRHRKLGIEQRCASASAGAPKGICRNFGMQIMADDEVDTVGKSAGRGEQQVLPQAYEGRKVTPPRHVTLIYVNAQHPFRGTST